MSVLAVWGAATSLLAAAVDGLAILPRPGLPIVGANSPIAALPVAALLALEAAVLLGLLQNGWRTITPDEWERLADKENYETVYDYDYAEPYRRLVYFPASAPDDSEAYFDSAEEHGEEGHNRRVSQNTPYGPYPHYPPPPQNPYRQAPRPSHPQNAYHHPQALPYHRYKRNIKNLNLDTGLEEITMAVEALEVEEDRERVAEEMKELSGQVLRLDRDHCLLKLLCHLQKKPQEERDAQDKTLLSVFGVRVAREDLSCGNEFPQCPVEEVQLVEAFSYLWQLQNDV